MWITLATVATTVFAVVNDPVDRPVGAGAGVVVGLFASASGLLYHRLRRRAGRLSGLLAVCLAWGAVFFTAAAADPHCPGQLAARHCTLATSADYLGVGLLFPVAVAVLAGPVAVLVGMVRRATPDQRRHPLRSMRAAALAALPGRLARRALPTSPGPETPRVRHEGRVTRSPRRPGPSAR